MILLHKMQELPLPEMPNCSSRCPASPRARLPPFPRRVFAQSWSNSRPSRLFSRSMQLYQTSWVFTSTVGTHQSEVRGPGGKKSTFLKVFSRAERTERPVVCREGDCAVKEKPCGLWLFFFLSYKKMTSLHESLRGQRLKHMHASCANTWTMSFFMILIIIFYRTVTCILETHSYGRLLCLFIGPFRWTLVNKRYVFFWFVLKLFHFVFVHKRNVNAVGEVTLRDNGHSAVRRSKTLVWMEDRWWWNWRWMHSPACTAGAIGRRYGSGYDRYVCEY